MEGSAPHNARNGYGAQTETLITLTAWKPFCRQMKDCVLVLSPLDDASIGEGGDAGKCLHGGGRCMEEVWECRTGKTWRH